MKAVGPILKRMPPRIYFAPGRTDEIAAPIMGKPFVLRNLGLEKGGELAVDAGAHDLGAVGLRDRVVRVVADRVAGKRDVLKGAVSKIGDVNAAPGVVPDITALQEHRAAQVEARAEAVVEPASDGAIGREGQG